MYIDLIGEDLQKGQVRSTRNQRACIIRCMNKKIYKNIFIFSHKVQKSGLHEV